MSWLELQPSGVYHVAFRYGGQKYKKSLKTKDRTEADTRSHRLDENIRLVESGRLVIPDEADVCCFLVSDGRLNGKLASRPSIRTLRHLSDQFFASISSGSLEASTVAGMQIHTRHLKRLLGNSFLIRQTQLPHLQDYIDARSRESGRRGRTISPATIKKELTTLRCMWNWARHAGYFNRPLPQKGLRYPKAADKPPFQTWSEIERRIARGGLPDAQQADLWDCLFLTLSEIDEFLKYVKVSAQHPFLYPMFVFAAHTGTRRSEMVRSMLDDIDLKDGMATIREKKRVRGTLTTRSVPLSPLLKRVLRKWFAEHPGGQHTFCLGPNVPRSKKRRGQILALTPDEAHDHFRRTVADTKWSRLRGWHVFRHSFCSNCAARGIDQRIINTWVGHQTEEMVRRYRHLIPNQQQKAIRTVFAR